MDNIGLFLANKLNCIDMPAPKYELIETISITESDIFTISRTTEPNGDAYNFDKMVVNIHIPVEQSNGDILLKFTGTKNIRFERAIEYVQGGKDMFAEIDVSGGIRKLIFSDVVVSSNDCYLYSRSDWIKPTNSKLTSLTINTSSSTVAFPTGSEITIYALRC